MLKSIDIKLSLPEDLVLSIGLPEEKLTFDIKKVYLFDLFSKGKISSGKAAEILGVSKIKFIDLLNDNGIPYYDYTEDEWHEEIQTVNEVIKKVKP